MAPARALNADLARAADSRQRAAQIAGKSTQFQWARAAQAIRAAAKDIKYHPKTGRFANFPSRAIPATLADELKRVARGEAQVDVVDGGQFASSSRSVDLNSPALIGGPGGPVSAYRPRFRQGGFALLMAFDVLARRRGISRIGGGEIVSDGLSAQSFFALKRELCREAQRFSDVSMAADIRTGSATSGWKSIESLETHGLVRREKKGLGECHKFFITTRGRTFTNELKVKFFGEQYRNADPYDLPDLVAGGAAARFGDSSVASAAQKRARATGVLSDAASAARLVSAKRARMTGSRAAAKHADGRSFDPFASRSGARSTGSPTDAARRAAVAAMARAGQFDMTKASPVAPVLSPFRSHAESESSSAADISQALVCGCGARAKSLRGLKMHRSRSKCGFNDDSPNSNSACVTEIDVTELASAARERTSPASAHAREQRIKRQQDPLLRASMVGRMRQQPEDGVQGQQQQQQLQPSLPPVDPKNSSCAATSNGLMHVSTRNLVLELVLPGVSVDVLAATASKLEAEMFADAESLLDLTPEVARVIGVPLRVFAELQKRVQAIQAACKSKTGDISGTSAEQIPQASAAEHFLPENASAHQFSGASEGRQRVAYPNALLIDLCEEDDVAEVDRCGITSASTMLGSGSDNVDIARSFTNDEHRQEEEKAELGSLEIDMDMVFENGPENEVRLEDQSEGMLFQLCVDRGYGRDAGTCETREELIALLRRSETVGASSPAPGSPIDLVIPAVRSRSSSFFATHWSLINPLLRNLDFTDDALNRHALRAVLRKASFTDTDELLDAVLEHILNQVSNADSPVVSLDRRNERVDGTCQNCCLTLVCDVRERFVNSAPRELFEALQDYFGDNHVGAEVMRQTLPVGDFQWQLQHQHDVAGNSKPIEMLSVIVERKRLSDILGRFESGDHLRQIARMGKIFYRALSHPILFVEGALQNAAKLRVYNQNTNAGSVDNEQLLIEEVAKLFAGHSGCYLLQSVDAQQSRNVLANITRVIRASYELPQPSMHFQNQEHATYLDDTGMVSSIINPRPENEGKWATDMPIEIPYSSTVQIARYFGWQESLMAAYDACETVEAKELLLSQILGDDDLSRRIFKAYKGEPRSQKSWLAREPPRRTLMLETSELALTKLLDSEFDLGCELDHQKPALDSCTWHNTTKCSCYTMILQPRRRQSCGREVCYAVVEAKTIDTLIRNSDSRTSASDIASTLFSVFSFRSRPGSRKRYESRRSERFSCRMVREALLPSAVLCISGRLPSRLPTDQDSTQELIRVQSLYADAIVTLTLCFDVRVFEALRPDHVKPFTSFLCRHVCESTLLLTAVC